MANEDDQSGVALGRKTLYGTSFKVDKWNEMGVPDAIKNATEKLPVIHNYPHAKYPGFQAINIEKYTNNPDLFPMIQKGTATFNLMLINVVQTFGDFARMNCWAASIKNNFANARLVVVYRRDRPYKDFLISLTPEIDETIVVEDDNVIPMDFLDSMLHPSLRSEDNQWYTGKYNVPDMILTHSMVNHMAMASLKNPSISRIPADREDELAQRLVDAGVDPNRWFCVIHIREGNYKYRMATNRDVDPAPYDSLTDLIIEKLGGQVVRLGHKGMTKFRDRPGYIDISETGDDSALQCYAISRARFGILGPSGPVPIASCFGIPIGLTDGIADHELWSPGPHMIILKHIVTPDGYLLDQQYAMDQGLYSEGRLYALAHMGFKVMQNTLAELFTVANHMVNQTTDCPGWRPPLVMERHKTPNEITWPLPAGINCNWYYKVVNK